jgi:MEMO1 family protein
MIRPSAVAGRFYPADAGELARQIQDFCVKGKAKLAGRGCMVPHAGYMYSGQVSGAVYSSLDIPAKCILLGPRHFPRGEALAILSEGSWQTPFGQAQIDSELAAEIVRACPQLRVDPVAHEREHSLEVQLPFLQQLARNFQFVPILLGTDNYQALENVGNAVARTISAQSESVLVIASSDMNHYENDALTRVKDKLAIDRVLALDASGLYDTVHSEGITMCGYAATVAMLVALQRLNVSRADLVGYATSGDVTGDRNEVVGYAGIILH